MSTEAPAVPQSAAASRGLYRGWWLVIGACVIAIWITGFMSYGFSAVFAIFRGKEFMWTASVIAGAASLRGIMSALGSPFVGKWVDKWGPRSLIAAAITCASIGIALLSFVKTVPLFYVAFFIISLGTAGLSTAAFMPSIAIWFRRKLGNAVTWYSCAVAVGGIMASVLTFLTDATSSWRTATLIIAVVGFVICIPFVKYFKGKPQDFGLLPDGMTPEEAKKLAAASQASAAAMKKAVDPFAEESITTGGALKMWNFWAINGSAFFTLLGITAVSTVIISHLAGGGFGREIAAIFATLAPIVSIVGRLGTGPLGTKYDRRKIMAIGSVLQVVGFLVFANVSGMPGNIVMPILFLVFWSVGYGMVVVHWNVVNREFFGPKNFGTINGLGALIGAAGAIAAPLIVGAVFDSTGSFNPAWYMLAVGQVIAAILILSAKKRTPKAVAQPAA